MLPGDAHRAPVLPQKYSFNPHRRTLYFLTKITSGKLRQDSVKTSSLTVTRHKVNLLLSPYRSKRIPFSLFGIELNPSSFLLGGVNNQQSLLPCSTNSVRLSQKQSGDCHRLSQSGRQLTEQITSRSTHFRRGNPTKSHIRDLLKKRLIAASSEHLKGQSHERVATQQCQISKMTIFHHKKHQDQVKEREKMQPGHQTSSC